MTCTIKIPKRKAISIIKIARKQLARQKSVLIGIEDRIGVVIKFGAIHVACGARCNGIRAACNA